MGNALSLRSSCFSSKASKKVKDGKSKERRSCFSYDSKKQYQDASTMTEQEPIAAPPKPVVLRATTSELLKCLGEFICRRCSKLEDLSPLKPGIWLRNLDRALKERKYGRFLTPASVIFLYMICRDVISSELAKEGELVAQLLTCAYITCSYMGNRTSYPAAPFMADRSKTAFWDRCLSIINATSAKMLRINEDQQYFVQIFVDLKAEAEPYY
ncbi:cyclin-dependent kinase 5 activator 1-like [Spea bombifrons]|uniref:cyclin-dependent kinase 5 activator 1-like n=1 Tax=Spea bombifrons TaxID=233779 RepID=UPI00234B0D48|nr:cyclin-dependent kinase 5 activator 1-like [Spea bombifrons]